MTLLTICQDALREIGGFNVPDTIVGNTDPTAVHLLALANRAGKDLALDYKWQELLETHSFSTVASTSAYALPADFHAIADGTSWDLTENKELVGPISRREWKMFESSEVNSVGVDTLFRIQGEQFNLYPTPSSVRSMVFEYYQKTYVSPNAGSDKVAFTLDDDTARIDEDLILLGVKYRFKAAKGLPNDAEEKEFNKRTNSLQASNKGAPTVRFGGARRHSNLPETGLGT